MKELHLYIGGRRGMKACKIYSLIVQAWFFFYYWFCIFDLNLKKKVVLFVLLCFSLSLTICDSVGLTLIWKKKVVLFVLLCFSLSLTNLYNYQSWRRVLLVYWSAVSSYTAFITLFPWLFPSVSLLSVYMVCKQVSEYKDQTQCKASVSKRYK